jgi:glyoxylase-like metal-dependent hydrolase (beta-lactamase superfamily II)
MQRERVADDIYVFTSELYAQVTAGLVLTNEGAVLIDTLLYPEETRAIKHFAENRLGCPIRYVINTHYHADHTYGTCFLPDAVVVAHSLCAALLDTRGREGLEQARGSVPELADVQIVLPGLLFTTTMTLNVGNKTFLLQHAPGHSDDCITCLVREDRVLFAGDALMSLPFFVDGDYAESVATLQSLQQNTYENIIQGHGEIILRGEVEEKIQSDLAYLAALKRHVDAARGKNDPQKYLERVDIERCGKSRILLNGSAPQLHHGNLQALFRRTVARPLAETG